jgi:hypothetical protein
MDNTVHSHEDDGLWDGTLRYIDFIWSEPFRCSALDKLVQQNTMLSCLARLLENLA